MEDDVSDRIDGDLAEYLAQQDSLRSRLYEIEAAIAAAPHWGAKLTALDEERKAILKSLTHG